MHRNIYKRRKYILGNTPQPKYIFSYFFLFLMGLVFFSVIFSLMSMETITITYYNDQVNVGSTPQMLLKKILGSVWIMVALGGFILFIVSTSMTHRVAGPAYRIDKSLDRMLRGEFGFRINLRTKDEMKGIAGKIEKLSYGFVGIRDKIVDELEDIFELIENTDLDMDAKRELIEKSENIKKIISLSE